MAATWRAVGGPGEKPVRAAWAIERSKAQVTLILITDLIEPQISKLRPGDINDLNEAAPPASAGA